MKNNRSYYDKVYVHILEKREVIGSYRIIAKRLKMALSTFHGIIERLIQEKKIIVDTRFDRFLNVTSTSFRIYGTKSYIPKYQDPTEYNRKIGTTKFMFTTRQHRLIDWVLSNAVGKTNRKNKMLALYHLRSYYLTEEEVLGHTHNALVSKYDVETFFVKVLGKMRHNLSAYVAMTNDITTINEHCDIRQILIANTSGKGGGIFAATEDEAFDVINNEMILNKKKFARTNKKRKFLRNNRQYRLILDGHEKETMDILK